jgi:hypothetical protein
MQNNWKDIRWYSTIKEVPSLMMMFVTWNPVVIEEIHNEIEIEINCGNKINERQRFLCDSINDLHSQIKLQS